MKRLVAVLLVGLLLIATATVAQKEHLAAAALPQAKEYNGMTWDGSLAVREITLRVDGDKINATLHKALSYRAMPMAQKISVEQVILDPQRFSLHFMDFEGVEYQFTYIP